MIVSRIIAQTCRQSCLSIVYTELLNFDKNEIYLNAFTELEGKTYGETLALFETSAVIGLSSRSGVRLNPPMDTVLHSDDELIAVTEDDDTMLLDGTISPAFDAEAIHIRKDAPAPPESILILGWNDNAPRIIRELDHYVAAGSRAAVASRLSGIEEDPRLALQGLAHLTVSFFNRDITDRETLDGLLESEISHVILLSDFSQPDMQKADASTLVTLLHLRDISEQTGKRFSIVSEMRDSRNRTLAEAARVNDFIVSDTITGLLVTQISENKLLGAVFEDIFDADGSEIYMKSVTDYIDVTEPVNFYTVVEAARQKGESAFGYKLIAEENENRPGEGVHINPKKSLEIKFKPGDCVIVAAEG